MAFGLSQTYTVVGAHLTLPKSNRPNKKDFIVKGLGVNFFIDPMYRSNIETKNWEILRETAISHNTHVFAIGDQLLVISKLQHLPNSL